MAHTETTLNSQTIFSGRIIEVKKDDIQLENGKKSIREVVVHHGGVCVAAIDQEDRLLLETYGKEVDFTDLSALEPIAGVILSPKRP